MKPIQVINKLYESNWEEKCKYIFNKYRDEFDTINEVRDISDYLNKLYTEEGMGAVDNWFLPSASDEYKKDFKSLITENKLKEDDVISISNEQVIKEINNLIIDEQEAIDGYEKAKINCLKFDVSSDEYDRLAKTFDHIIEEEKEHIEELKALVGGIK